MCMRCIFILVTLSFTIYGVAQNISNNCYTTDVVNYVDPLIEKEHFYKTTSKQEICQKKHIRLIFHFMLQNSGTGNFTPDGNGGTEMNAYDFSTRLIEILNKDQNFNSSLNLPPGNNLEVLDKNFYFTIEQILFHTNSNAYHYGSSVNNYIIDGQNIVNVFFQQNPSFNGSDCNSGNDCCDNGGNASRASFNDIGPFVISMQDQYCLYRYYRNSINNMAEWIWVNGFAQLLLHEIGHLLGLSHTVRFNSSCPCPSNPYPYSTVASTSCISLHSNSSFSLTSNCFDDGIDDTPSVQDMFEVYNSPIHPACGERTENIENIWKFCSNNLMDYNKNRNLSPGQINTIHFGLENSPIGTKSIRVCNKLNSDNSICSFNYPILTHYGKSVNVAFCQQPTNVDIYSTIFYEKEVIIDSDFEIKTDFNRLGFNAFEIKQACKCD